MSLAVAAAVSVAATCGVAASASAAPTRPAGSLISQSPASAALSRPYSSLATRTNLTYVSTNARSGAKQLVTGTLFVPKGPVPKGGWPIIGYGHGTSGVVNRCAPSKAANLFGSKDAVLALLKKGFAVAVADYAGLGDGGQHAYVSDGRTTGYNVIDSVRAARAANKNISKSAALLSGISQGGQAALYAAESAPTYAPGTVFKGVSVASPPLNLVPIVDAIRNRTLTPAQVVTAPSVVKGWTVVDKSVKFDDFIGGKYRSGTNVPWFCTAEPTFAQSVKTLNAGLQGGKMIRFANWHAVEVARKILAENTLPHTKLTMPVFIIRGDHDTLVTTSWQTPQVKKMCQIGDNLRQVIRPGDHVDGDDGAALANWDYAAIHGKYPASNCKSVLSN